MIKFFEKAFHTKPSDGVCTIVINNDLFRFEKAYVIGSQAIDFDFNYFDGSPIIGPHPYIANMWMACGFGGYGGCLAPATGRAITELMYDDGYHTIDLSRFAFDRVLLSKPVKEKSQQLFFKTALRN